MVKILVKKSAPKGVLIKKRVGQQLPNDQGLFQTPDRGKSFMDFFRTTFAPKNRQDIGVKQRLAGLAGMAGKGLAGLGAVNESMQSMQGGNLSAPLGIGYSYERLDPTGRMISDAANPNPQPRLSIEEQRGNVNQVALPAPVAPIPALPAPTAPLPPVTPNGQPTLFNPAYQETANVPGNLNQDMMSTNTATLTPTQNPVLQPQEIADVPGNLNQDMMENSNDPNNPNNPNANKSFVTALTEKLGADIVYKMTPHEIGTFSAYTLLKLR